MKGPKKSVEDIIEEIRRDNRSGAAELTWKAARALRILVESTTHVKELTERFHKTAIQLIEAQPAMAPILNLVNKVSLKMEGLDRIGEIKVAVDKELRKTRAEQKKSSRQIAKNFYRFITSGCSLATYSYSSTVIGALTYASGV